MLNKKFSRGRLLYVKRVFNKISDIYLPITTIIINYKNKNVITPLFIIEKLPKKYNFYFNTCKQKQLKIEIKFSYK